MASTSNDKKKSNNPNIVKGNCYGKQFTSEYQPSPERKALGQLKKKTLEELKNSILDKSFKLIDEKLDNEEITSGELLAIFNKAVEMSGFKKDKIDTTIKTYSLFEDETQAKANELELNQRTKKIDKK